MLNRAIWLVKDSDEVVSWCRCTDAIAALPPQMDCPWCGCGWLFACAQCHKCFTFARAVILQESIQSIAARIYRGSYSQEPDDTELQETIEYCESIVQGLQPDDRVVIIDGVILRIDTPGPFSFSGWYAAHEFGALPQVEAKRNPAAMAETLESKRYWLERRLPDSD
jgi:hypothetical protein